MTLDHEMRDDCLILRPVGRLDNSSSPELERCVTEQMEGAVRCIVFDFSGMDYISSAGLRVVLLAGKRLKAAGGGIALAGMRDLVRDVFEMSGFISLFPVAATADEAVRQMA
jgi:anti-sigma B factor antagonist/stage II sporulation protein AA (anti-sigma F factor antagonist)